MIDGFTREERRNGIALFFAYAAATEIGIRLFTAPTFLSPAPGVALAGLLLGGARLWPVLYLASQAIYLAHGFDFASALALPAANVLQALAGIYILKRFGFDNKMRRLRDMLSLMLMALLASVVVPTLGFASRYFDFYLFSQPLPRVTWGSWWTGITMSTLIVTPFIVRWAAPWKPERMSRAQAFEAVAVIGSLIAIEALLFLYGKPSLWGISLVYFMIIPLMWIALRLGVRYMTLALMATAIIAFTGLFVGRIMPPSELLAQRLFQTEIFLQILALIFFPLSTIEEERKSAVRKLESHVEQLQDAVGIRDEFISIASHELKTPVTTMKIYSQVMRKELESRGDGDLEKQVARMESQLDRLHSLVEDLLNISRSRRGRLEFTMREFDLESLVREVCADIQPNSRSHAIEVRGSLSRTVVADRDRIGQVLVNLLNNAIKYSPKSDRVIVTLSENGVAQVSVRDFGIGIQEKHHEKIFDLFYRVSELGGKTFPGFGIGLHISNEIVKRHNGEIRVKSVIGEGSEFSFTLPYPVPAEVATDEVSLDAGEKAAFG